MDIKDLYQELLIDHGTHPRNCCKLNNATHSAEGFNPLCGDKIILYMEIKNGLIEKITFEGNGCAISTATASLMTETLVNKSIADAEKIFQQFQDALTTDIKVSTDDKDLGKLTAIIGVKEFPARVKCATLAWHTLKAALLNQKDVASSE